MERRRCIVLSRQCPRISSRHFYPRCYWCIGFYLGFMARRETRTRNIITSGVSGCLSIKCIRAGLSLIASVKVANSSNLSGAGASSDFLLLIRRSQQFVDVLACPNDEAYIYNLYCSSFSLLARALYRYAFTVHSLLLFPSPRMLYTPRRGCFLSSLLFIVLRSFSHLPLLCAWLTFFFSMLCHLDQSTSKACSFWHYDRYLSSYSDQCGVYTLNKGKSILLQLIRDSNCNKIR